MKRFLFHIATDCKGAPYILWELLISATISLEQLETAFFDVQAVDWWEKAAQTAVEEGIDPAEATGLFQRADEIAGILKAAFKSKAGSARTPQGQSQSSWPSLWSARRVALSGPSGLSTSSGHAQGLASHSS